MLLNIFVDALDLQFTFPGSNMSKRRMRNVALAADNTLSFNQYVEKRKTVTLIPKSLNQESYIELLTDPTKHIVFATGPAGKIGRAHV